MPDVYHVEDVILSVQLVLVLLCKIFSIKKIKMLEKEEEYGLHAKLMDLQILLEDIHLEILKVIDLDLKLCTRFMILINALDIKCV